MRKVTIMATTFLAIGAIPSATLSQAERVPAASDAKARADKKVAEMTADEKTVLTHGVMAIPMGPDAPPIPKDAVTGAGYIAGLPRLGIPALRETDASLGVSYIGGLRNDGATALPSGIAMAATWDPALVYRGGAAIGAEARAKGFNVLLGGGANLIRDPRNGRTFEYLSEDPLLTGELVGSAIAGVQSNHIISTIKHFTLNAQETARKFADARIAESALRESDLLAFQIGIEKGRPGAVMCSYNLVNGANACNNDWLLNQVLKRDWGYPGFVMSDWGAVTGLDTATNGLDQQSGEQLDAAVYFGSTLKDAAARDPVVAARVTDMNKRILTSIYANGLDRYPVVPGGSIDVAAGAAVAKEIAEKAIVLLKNRDGLLPLAGTATNIAVIGGYADTGVLSGGGSSQTHALGGPAATVPFRNDGPMASFVTTQYQRSVPTKAIATLAPNAKIDFRDGRYIGEAVEAAKRAEVVVIFATQWMTEGYDVPDLSLPGGQDALIAAVAKANPNTIVVLETGGPVEMPWLNDVGAVLSA